MYMICPARLGCCALRVCVRWLRDSFLKARDPVSGNPLALPASWALSGSFRVLLAVGLRLQAFTRQRVMVWISKRVYGPGDELRLQGPGLAELGHITFLVAFKCVPVPVPVPVHRVL